MPKFSWDEFAGGLARGGIRGFGVGSRIATLRGERNKQQEQAERIAQILESEGAPPQLVQAAYTDWETALDMWEQQKKQQQDIQATTTAYERTPYGGMAPEQQGLYQQKLATGRAAPLTEEERQTELGWELKEAEGRAKIGAQYRRPQRETGGLTEAQAYNIAQSDLGVGADPHVVHTRVQELLGGKKPIISQQMTARAGAGGVGWEHYPEAGQETGKVKPPQDFIEYINDRKAKGIPINWDLIEQEHPDWDLTGLR